MITRLLLVLPVLLLPLAAYAQSVPESREQVQLSFSPVVKKVAPAVVSIYAKKTVTRSAGNPFMNDPFFAPFFRNGFPGGRMRKQVENALGSGVILDPDGLVVTNAHVARNADEITVVLTDGREFEADVALVDEASDLAILRIHDKTGAVLPFVSLKPSEALEVGDLVLAVGNPFGVGQTVTSGIVSAQGRSSLDINDFNFFIQTDAAINPGNSGGPLVALDGGVVGINTAIYSRDGGSLGIGFAIPSEMVASVIAAEKAGVSARTQAGGIVRPWLGVSVQTVTADIADSLGLARPQGALIASIHPASPLLKADIKVGDIVLSVAGKTVRDPAEMKFRMATVPMGQSAVFEILRQGARTTHNVLAMAPPDDPPRRETVLKGAHILKGVTLANLNPAVAIELGMPEEDGGVVILKIPSRSPAAQFLSPGDLLLEINGIKMTGPGDAEKVLSTSQRGLSALISSGGRTRRLVIR